MGVEQQRHKLRTGIDNAVRAALVAVVSCGVVVMTRSPHVAAERHIAAAAGHVCMVQDGGAVACRGNASTINKFMPPANVAFHAVTVGDDFSCGLAVNGSLRCWGALPGGMAQLPPVSTFFVEAHAGPRHVCGLVPNGTVLCFGDASSSRGATNVPRGVSFQGVSAGTNYTCGVARNHSVVCWGDADNPVVANASIWQAITDAEHVATGADHACYVRVNGSVGCWGSNSRGGAAPPAALATAGAVWWLATGPGMTCAMSGWSVPGPVTCWGAVNGTMAAAGYEVACAAWGCVASTTSTSSRLVVSAAAGGGGVPQNVVVSVVVGAPVVSTLAGSGSSGTADGVGTLARFSYPSGVSLDGTGGLYVADYNYALIRRVDLVTRNVVTVAGIAGSYGTAVGATPLQSQFNYPYGVEADGAGNVYVADTENHAIRMLSGAWVAGSTSGTSGSSNAAGTSATFYKPYVVRADVAGGLLFVADTYNYKVRTIAIAGSNTVATLATLPSYVYDIALDPAVRVMYVAVQHSVYALTYTGASTLLAGSTSSSGYVDGTGGVARFNVVTGVASDLGAGVLYAADNNNHRIRRIIIVGGVVTTLAGSGSQALTDGVGTAAAFKYPWGIALDASSGNLYIGDRYNHAIRQLQLQTPIPAILAAAPLPPPPLAATHQLTAWRALGISNGTGTTAATTTVLDARNTTFSSPLAAANTAGLNPAIGNLWLGNVTLAPRDPTPAAAGNTNTTFSTSAQRCLRLVTLYTPAVPVSALALPALANVTLLPSIPTQQLQLAAGSFNGLPTLTCINCGGTAGLANLSNFRVSDLLRLPPALPLITSLDASNVSSLAAVFERSFDGMPALRWLSLASSNVTYISDGTFSSAKQPALAVLDQSRIPLLSGTTCPPGTYYGVFRLPASGAQYFACASCPAGTRCAGGTGLPVPCGANTYAPLAAAACTPCPPGSYATGSAKDCAACASGVVAPACNATASWRDTITVVADGAAAWVNASIFLIPAGKQPTAVNVSCGLVEVLSTTTVSCALPFLLPAAPTAPVLTQVWVAHAGTGGIPQRLNTTVSLVPPPQVVVAPGGGIGLAPLTPGVGRIVLRLPAPRLTAADWEDAGLPPPPQATIDSLAVWLRGTPCTEPVWETATTLSCATPATDASNVAAVVQLAGGAFNVSGVLPSLLSAAAYVAASGELQLLPPAQSAPNPIINITLVGVALCTSGGGVPQLTSIMVAGVPCTAAACIPGRSDAALCVGWNASDPAIDTLRSGPSSQATANVTVTWVNSASRPVTCAACVTLASRPVLTSITPTSVAAAGVPVVVTGVGIMDATRTPPVVLIGGEVCTNALVLSPTVVQCAAPVVFASAPGYPVVSVVVVNAAGAASIESVNLTYPATFAVSWASTPPLAALPGGMLTPAPTLLVSSRQAATCTLSVNLTSCTTTNQALASRPAGMAVTTSAAALAVGASNTPAAVSTDLWLGSLVASGASGCAGTLTAACIDAVGLTASTAGQSNPTVALAAWRADWANSGLPNPFIVVPEALPQLTAVFSLVGSDGVLTAANVASLSCLALLLPAAITPPPLTQALDRVSSHDVLSSVSSAGVLRNASTAGITFTGLTALAARLGQALALYAECTWTPTGERLRLPSLTLAVANASLALTPAATLLVEAYESAGIAAAATLSPAGVATFAGAAATCAWRTTAATSSSIVLAVASSAATFALRADGGVGGLALTVEGPPGETLTLQLVCNLWGANAVASPPLSVTSHAYIVTQRGDGASGSTVRAVWPSGPQTLLPWTPALAVTAPARSVLACSLAVASVTLPPAAAVPGVGLGLTDAAVQLVGEVSVSLSLAVSATRANVSLPLVGLRAPGGTNASLALTCRDGVGRSAALSTPLQVAVTSLTAAWSAATVAAMPSIVVPSQALPPLTLTVASTPAVPLPSNADATSLSCVAAIFRASTPLPLSTSLVSLIASASPFEWVSTATAGASVTTGADNTTITVTLPRLSLAACHLATPLVVVAECTWAPTGERVRLPPLATSTLQMTLGWVAPPTTALAYAPLPLHLAAAISAPATDSSGATTVASCEVLLVNATVRSTRLVVDAWPLIVDANAAGSTSMPTSVNVTLQAPPATQLYVQAACTAWGQVLATPPMPIITASLETRMVSALPSTFIASDASSPWPLEPPLVVAVVMSHNDAVVADATCTVTSSTPATDLVGVDATPAQKNLRSLPADTHTGVVAVPRLVRQASPAMPLVSLVVECQHLASGEAMPPLSLTIPATLLDVQPCVPPATKAAVGDPLPAFSVGIAVTTPGGTRASPCTATAIAPQQFIALPPIVCTIALNVSASSINDTSAVFLQHTAVVVGATSHISTFDAFTMVVPQGQTYGLTLVCTVGGLAIPPALPFAVEVEGCRAGQASESVTCVTCGGGSFSLGGKGAVCIGCPPVGSACNAGILTLLPHYFRPAAQAGMPLGPDTELHPCFNSEACTLEYSGNASGAFYGCAYGYVGPLCGICDTTVNYARFGGSCSLCWDAGASWLFLLGVVTLVLAVLTRVALRKDASNSDASIAPRITLGFLQAVGRRRVFRAGRTKAYDTRTGGTEAAGASPVSVGALQCILRLPYLFQYVSTVLLPVLAAVAVVVIFHSVTTGRSVQCKPRCSMDKLAFKSAVAVWWASKRHLSTLLFVLFLTYMPIVSASLRALDCIEPVAGIRYLRSDLGVECGVGEHAAARALAYTVLVMLGIGFPVGLAWLLGTARNDQLADVGFRATWGFLFDGYRAPKRTLVTQQPPPGAPDAGGGSSSNLFDSLRKLMGLQAVPVVRGVAIRGVNSKLAGVPIPVAASARSSASGRRRSTLMPERLTQAWVVSGDSRVWWEAIVLCRKAGVVLLAVLVTNPYMQCVGASLWFLTAFVLQVRYRPYTKPQFNWLELTSLSSTLLTAIISTALLQYNVSVSSAELHPPDAMTAIEWAVTVLLAVINVGTFSVLAGMWLRLQCARAQGIMRRTSLVTVFVGRHMAGLRASLARRRSSAATAASAAAAATAAAAVRSSIAGKPAPSPTAAHAGGPTPTKEDANDATATPIMNPLRLRLRLGAAAAAGAPADSGAAVPGPVPTTPTSDPATVSPGSAADAAAAVAASAAGGAVAADALSPAPATVAAPAATGSARGSVGGKTFPPTYTGHRAIVPRISVRADDMTAASTLNPLLQVRPAVATTSILALVPGVTPPGTVGSTAGVPTAAASTGSVGGAAPPTRPAGNRRRVDSLYAGVATDVAHHVAPPTGSATSADLYARGIAFAVTPVGRTRHH